jgi:hypothetical protein
METPAKAASSLDPSAVEHLTTTLGPPQPFLLTIQHDRDVYANAWVVGVGHVKTADAQRGTDVEIRLTPGGRLVTTRRSWTSGGEVEQRGDVHETPDQALDWLLADGKGKLGPASKQAWVAACGIVPSMRGMDVRRVE